ncbi:MAG TPA: alpha/beta fold hydrolase, partial [Candidatus Kapabacteria bacterium]|nr:alpha/beta fold hydrolase [Candidatus Kapabacteria bacterium]
WLPRGFILVSTNYRLLPDAAPLEQARDVARAVARTQALATEWGGDPERVVLMGHSAGAHLVALLNANPAEALALGARPWRGAVALDSAAMDIRPIMEARHPRFYDKAFGNVPSNWDRVSPLRQLVSGAPPLLAVCSSQRSDSCRQAEGLQARAQTLGVRIEVQPQDLSHGEINGRLGLPGPYTAAVTAFVDSLLPAQP